MRKLLTIFFVATLLLSYSAFTRILFAQDADTLDVPQGFETLNIAVQGDTTETGEVKNPNRVYRLERGGFYLLNGTIGGVKGAPLRIVAAEGDGPMPILIPAVDETGSASRAFRPRGDGLFVGLYVTGIDNLGNQAGKNMFRCEKTGGRYVIDNCFLDSDAQSFVRMNSEDQRLFITNTIMRNSFLLADPANGRMIDTRGNTQDTIFVQNSTLYTNSSDPLRSGGGIIKNVFIDHVTLYQTAGSNGEFDVDRAINCTFTNNLMVDFGFEGRVLGDSLKEVIVPIDTLDAPDLATEDQRHYTIKNNVYGFTPELEAWIAGKDSLELYPMHDQRTERFLATYPNMVSENNIMENPGFSDAPDPNVIVTYAEYRFQTNYSNENNPDIRADRNGTGSLTDDPTSVGPAPDEYDFDYSTDSQAYTHAEGGFPVGDLNWFPDKKAEWEAWVKTGVRSKASAGLPVDFTLKQNYPNPFNPSTTIVYELASPSTVKLDIYNALGQKVKTLLNARRQQPGRHEIQWNGLNDADQPVGNGVYLYRLQVGQKVQTKKMVLMK